MRPRRPAPARGAAFAALFALVAASLLDSCSWLLNDSLPSWFSRATASIDLGSEISSVTASGMRYTPTVTALSVAGRDIVQFQTLDGRMRLFVLGSGDLGFRRALDDSQPVFRGGNWGVDAEGRPVTGNSGGATALDASSLPVTLTSTGPDNAYYCSDASTNYIVSPSSSVAGIDVAVYDSTWSSQTATPPIPYSSASSGTWSLVAFGMSANGPRILLEEQTASTYVALGWHSMAGLIAAASLVEGAPLKTGSANPSNSSLFPGVWLCADGMVVASSNDNSGAESLAHFGFDGSQSSFDLQPTADVTVDFGPGSADWFVYEGSKGRLSKEKPWW